MKKNSIQLVELEKKVICIKCGGRGAFQFYGEYFPDGVGELANELTVYEDVRNKPHMSRAMGFGGTIPHTCMNLDCGNTGLIDYGGLEGYEQAFMSIKEPLRVIEGEKGKKKDKSKDGE